MSLRIFGAPPRYYQGPGALDRLGEVLADLGGTPLLVADAFVLDMLGDRLTSLCETSGVSPMIRAFGGEITYPAIDALVAGLDGRTPTVVAGIGGGKALDAAKALAVKLGAKVITVPTIASNDSPTSSSIAMYDDAHVMIAVDRMPRSPEAVIVDTALIASAPADFLRAGIGDAIAKKFEARGCAAGLGITPFATRPLLTALAIGDACYDTLRTHSKAALAACERSQPDDALEAVVEACVLMAGLGFENGGLSLAHSLTRGLVKMRGTRDAIHGRQIAWATLVQRAHDGDPDSDLRDFAAFLTRIGLPVTLAGLGMTDPTGTEIDQIAEWTMTAPHLANLHRPADAGSIARAIRQAEALTNQQKETAHAAK